MDMNIIGEQFNDAFNDMPVTEQMNIVVGVLIGMEIMLKTILEQIATPKLLADLEESRNLVRLKFQYLERSDGKG